ncbi:unnamed protein product, partial [marine sediment metagenome]
MKHWIMENTNLKILKIEAGIEIEKVNNLKELDIVFKKYLGKKGKITQVLRSLKDLSEKERKKKGKLANQVKQKIEKTVEAKRKKFIAFDGPAGNGQEKGIDITVPGEKPVLGHLHPLTLVKRKIEEIFQAMGFSVIEGPEIESEWYNFDALNIPKDHPARDFWDTLYLKNGLLLRTHTSPVQIRYMEKNNPPLRVIVPGRVFRHEATDASHDIQFYQVEGLMIGKDITAANFRAIIQEFFSRFFEKPVKIRLRPSFFPFTEPSFEADISCLTCGGKGCSVCSKTG